MVLTTKLNNMKADIITDILVHSGGEDFTAEELEQMTRAELFELWLRWTNAIVGYGDSIIATIESLYGVELNDEDE